MDPRKNPFAPGAGTKPPFLAGRDDLVATAELALARAKNGLSAKSFVAVGLRGVGKTVVLNRVLEVAQDAKYQVAYIEARDDSSFASLIMPKMRTALMKISSMAKAKQSANRALMILKQCANALKVNIGEIAVEFDFGDGAGTADSGDLENDLPDLLVEIGKAAKENGTAICILIDEIQYLSENELSAIIMGIHQTSQRGLPILIVAAGLPQILGKMGQSKSYAERLFEFPRVGPLNRDDAYRAISEPAGKLNVIFQEDALSSIFDSTEGYPYFIQEWGYVTWNLSDKSPITKSNAMTSNDEAIKRLDESFFRVRLERMNPSERKYMRAMAELGRGPHASGDIAKIYGARVTTVAPTRSSLISKGMIYSPSYGSTDFTVPLYDQFMRREMPDWK